MLLKSSRIVPPLAEIPAVKVLATEPLRVRVPGPFTVRLGFARMPLIVVAPAPATVRALAPPTLPVTLSVEPALEVQVWTPASVMAEAMLALALFVSVMPLPKRLSVLPLKV